MSYHTTRRRAASGLAALLAMPGAARAAGGDAAVEGTLTWYIAQVDAQTAENLGRSFTQGHPGVNVGVIRTTGQVAYQRLLMDIKNHTPQCDVFSTTDISHMPILKERHELTEYTPANAAALLPAFKALSDPGYSYITNAARYFLIYNKDKVKPEDAPRAWTDLLDPKWKGRVATGHPAFSGCTGTWALGLKKVHGWAFFEELAKNDPRIGRSAADPMTLITAGECLVGVGSANNAYASVESDRHRASVRRVGVVRDSVGHSRACAAPERGKAVHGVAAESGLRSDDYRRRERANPGGRGAASRHAAAGRAEGDSADGGGDPRRRARSHRAVARHFWGLSRVKDSKAGRASTRARVCPDPPRAVALARVLACPWNPFVALGVTTNAK